MTVLRRQLTTDVHFQPLPDSQYNGNPESVGYRIKYWRPDLQSPALAQVINDRLEREFTVEELEEWTEYELQMQAFNAIGAGPWSEVVRGRTRESGKVQAPPAHRLGPSPRLPVWSLASLNLVPQDSSISLACPISVYVDTLLTQSLDHPFNKSY